MNRHARLATKCIAYFGLITRIDSFEREFFTGYSKSFVGGTGHGIPVQAEFGLYHSA